MPDAHYGPNGTAPQITLRPIDIEDWAAVHEWASTIEACRYQAWAPNTVADTKAFVAQAVRQWGDEPQDRYVWIAKQRGGVVGLGELTISGRRWRQGEVGMPYTSSQKGCNTGCERTACRVAFVRGST